MELLRVFLCWEEPVGEHAKPGVGVEKSCGASLVYDSEFLEAVKKLLDVWIIVGGGSPTANRRVYVRMVELIRQGIDLAYPKIILVVREFEYRRM